jgi:Putative peptidoglycan binding domain
MTPSQLRGDLDRGRPTVFTKHRSYPIPLAALVLALGALLPSAVSPTAASADACYTWNRTLRLTNPNMRGNDVRQLQIRIAGWGGFRNYVNIDGIYGSETSAAVRRFQAAYRLDVDGVAGPQTFAKLYELQDADCTPKHFAYEEFDNSSTCGEQNFGANAGAPPPRVGGHGQGSSAPRHVEARGAPPPTRPR